jgi:hypothetical protein
MQTMKRCSRCRGTKMYMGNGLIMRDCLVCNKTGKVPVESPVSEKPTVLFQGKEFPEDGPLLTVDSITEVEEVIPVKRKPGRPPKPKVVNG